MEPALPAMLSTNIPIVIRLGKAWGLMMISGWMPLSLKGKSIAGHFCEHTPFWPCREENLSPMIGDRVIRKVMWTFCSSLSPASLPTENSELMVYQSLMHTYQTDLINERRLVPFVFDKLSPAASVSFINISGDIITRL